MAPVKSMALRHLDTMKLDYEDDTLSWIELPSGISILKDSHAQDLEIQGSFKGKVRRSLVKETVTISFTDNNKLPDVYSEWENGTVMVYSVPLGYFADTVVVPYKGHNKVTLKNYPIVAADFLDLMTTGRQLGQYTMKALEL